MTRRKELSDILKPKPIVTAVDDLIEDITPENIHEEIPVVSTSTDPYVPVSVFNDIIKELRESILKEVESRLSTLEQAPSNIIESIQPEQLKSIEERLLALESVKQQVRNQPVAWTVERDADGNLVRLKPE